MKNGKIAVIAAMILAAASAAYAAEANFDGRANKDLTYCGSGMVCNDLELTHAKSAPAPGGGGHVDNDLTIGHVKAYPVGNGGGNQTDHSITQQKAYMAGNGVGNQTDHSITQQKDLIYAGGTIHNDQTIQHVKATAGLLKYYKAQPALKAIVADFYNQMGNGSAARKVQNGDAAVAAYKGNAYVVQDGRITTIENSDLAAAISRAVSGTSRYHAGLETFSAPYFVACMYDDECKQDLVEVWDAVTEEIFGD